jgi:hypothetical protein
MPGALRSFTGHFAPHVALTLFLLAVVSLVPSFFVVGVQPGVTVPTWRVAITVFAIVVIGWIVYTVLRYYHDRHQCSRCDRNGMRDRYRLAPMGFLARHFHWCRTAPGIWIYLAAWFLTMLLSIVSSLGTVLIYAGMALWTASTIAHQARIRSCPSHTASIMYKPTAKWFSIERLLNELHYRARGVEHLHLQCERYACDVEATVSSPEEAVLWTLGHSDFHASRSTKNPMVLVKVTLDPDPDLEMDSLYM